MQSERVFSSSLRYRFVAYCLLLYSTSQCISTGITRASRLRLCCNWTRPCGPASVRLRFSQCRTRPLRGRPRRASLGALHRRRLLVESHTKSVGARSASSQRGLSACCLHTVAHFVVSFPSSLEPLASGSAQLANRLVVTKLQAHPRRAGGSGYWLPQSPLRCACATARYQGTIL